MTSNDLAPEGSKARAESTAAGIVLEVDAKPTAAAFLIAAQIRYFAEITHQDLWETITRLGQVAVILSQSERVNINLLAVQEATKNKENS